MFQRYAVTVFMAGVAFLSQPAYSQPEDPEFSRQDVAVQGFGSFLKSTTHNGVEQTSENSGGVLASYRFFFSKNHGVEASYGYTQNTQKYQFAPGLLSMDSHSHQLSGAYVFRMPLKNITPYALAGVGALIFDPKNFTGASTQTRAAFLYGGGADIRVTNNIFVRAEYRGFLYNSPTYDLPSLAGTGRTTHLAQPSVGFGFTF